MSFGQKIRYILGAAIIAGAMVVSAGAPAMAVDPDAASNNNNSSNSTSGSNSGSSGGSITCPEGSLRAGKTVERVADCNVQEVKKENQLPQVAVTLIDVVLGALGIVAVAVVILGGIQYITSTGDPAKTRKAKDTILYGIIGLIVAFLAFAIVNFVIAKL